VEIRPRGRYDFVVLGWPYPVHDRGWHEVRAFLSAPAFGSEFAYLHAIIDSVVGTAAENLLAVGTSMHDLIVTVRDGSQVPSDVVIVRAPNSLRHHPSGTVRIDYLESNGRVTTIERPTDEAVALFWRFLETEFGLSRRGS
jgi:hypothetical protein